MRKFQSQTLADVLNTLAHAAADEQIVGLSDYGDHNSTMQAIPLTGLEVVFLEESGYSNTGFKILDDGRGDEDSQKAISLNPDMNMDIEDALTADEVIALIKNKATPEMLELPVTFGSDYGDRVSTTQANRSFQDDFGSCDLAESCYSDSGWAATDDVVDARHGFFSIG